MQSTCTCAVTLPADMSGLVADVVESAAFKKRHATAHTEIHGHQIVGRVLSHLGMDPHTMHELVYFRTLRLLVRGETGR